MKVRAQTNQIKNLRVSRGFTLMEVMISVAIIGLIMAGIFSILAATQQLWTNGFSINQTALESRKVYDRVISELYESPSGIAVPMRVNNNGTRLEEAVSADGFESFPAEGLVYAQVVGGPLKILSTSDIAPDTTTFTVFHPPLDSDLHLNSIAAQQNIDIRVGDYFAPTSSSEQFITAREKRITNVVYDATGSPGGGPSWTITLDSGYPHSFFADTSDTYTIDTKTYTVVSYNAATILRYNAFLVIPDLTADGLTRDSLVLYEGLRVLDRVDGDLGDPTRVRLPNNYQQSYTQIISNSLMPYPFDDTPYDEAGDNLRPFFKPASFISDGNLQLPWVRVRLAITGGDFSDVIQVGEMARMSNIDTRIFMRSGSL